MLAYNFLTWSACAPHARQDGVGIQLSIFEPSELTIFDVSVCRHLRFDHLEKSVDIFLSGFFEEWRECHSTVRLCTSRNSDVEDRRIGFGLSEAASSFGLESRFLAQSVTIALWKKLVNAKWASLFECMLYVQPSDF